MAKFYCVKNVNYTQGKTARSALIGDTVELTADQAKELGRYFEPADKQKPSPTAKATPSGTE